MRKIDFDSSFNRSDRRRDGAGYTGAGPTPDRLVLQRRGTPPLHVSYRSPMPRVGQWKDRHLRPQSASALIDGEMSHEKRSPASAC